MAYRFNVFTGNLDIVSDTFPGDFSFAYGSKTIVAGYVLNEDGTYALNEDGSRIILESAISYVLNEDGSYALNEDGSKILAEDSEDTGGTRVTQLATISIPSPMIWVTPNVLNSTTVWIGGSNVAIDAGIPLFVGGKNIFFPIIDVSDLWITGNVNDGVTFAYIYIPEQNVTDDDGNIVRDDDGNIINAR